MAQLWVNLPRQYKLAPPRYQAIRADQMGRVTLPADAGEVRVLAGDYRGVQGPLDVHDPSCIRRAIERSGGCDFELPGRENTGLLVMQGDVSIQGSKARQHDFVLLQNAGERLRVEADSAAQLLLLSGEPIDEPVVQYGPFVMNTAEEIVQAFEDLRDGKFGHLDD
jgi:redox-sensitive bicupin YhaK (pirin superfamily)